MGLFSKIGKAAKAVVKPVTRTVGKVAAPALGLSTLGLVKPSVLGIKSNSAENLFKAGSTVGRVAAGASVATFAAVGAPTALGGAGVGKGGILAALSGFFSPKPPGLASKPGEPETTFGSTVNQRLETLGGAVPEGGQAVSSWDSKKMVMIGLIGVAIVLVVALLLRRRK